MRFFMCYWGNGYFDEDEGEVALKDETFFCDANGYNDDEGLITAIKELKIGESFISHLHGFNGHIITCVEDPNED